jgi:hypothetical protein
VRIWFERFGFVIWRAGRVTLGHVPSNLFYLHRSGSEVSLTMSGQQPEFESCQSVGSLYWVFFLFAFAHLAWAA